MEQISIHSDSERNDMTDCWQQSSLLMAEQGRQHQARRKESMEVTEESARHDAAAQRAESILSSRT